ncbi:hypothetical protein POVWA2_049920 [Plasmodium ovale wallikeri]|uniref:Uncharacterized protein n=1 Tax=Plasmodium ovale wallikeri TaxID=864142 RepID=A0A1A8ZM77_PLAOA|nr:hypothetical protein POVWA1_051170 [Plasmodium ovale wallikeri]SBT45415.1 hypothetical protein POVWA2_049920 [Plasmodium ovale wallikeri]
MCPPFLRGISSNHPSRKPSVHRCNVLPDRCTPIHACAHMRDVVLRNGETVKRRNGELAKVNHPISQRANQQGDTFSNKKPYVATFVDAFVTALSIIFLFI